MIAEFTWVLKKNTENVKVFFCIANLNIQNNACLEAYLLATERSTFTYYSCWNSFLTKWCGPFFRWVFRPRRLSEEPEFGHDVIVTVNTMR